MSGATGDGALRFLSEHEYGKNALKLPYTYRLVRMEVSPDLKIVRRRAVECNFPVQGMGNQFWITATVSRDG